MAEETQKRWGDRLYIGGSEESRLLCLKVPLALQFLLQMEGWPLGRFSTIVGPPESCKSALAYEFCRLHCDPVGGFDIIETEKKDSAVLRKSITGYDKRYVRVFYADSIEVWQSALCNSLQVMRELEDQLKPPRSLPWCFVVDSLMGVATEGQGGKIDDSGAASLVQPQAANIISTYMKRLGHWFDLYPFSVIGVNHLKLAPDSYGNMNQRKIGGGYAPRFHESIELESIGIGKQFERGGLTGRKLRLQVAKNSCAAHSPWPVEVEFLWFEQEYVERDGINVRRQHSYWDWQSAAVDILLCEDLPAADRKRIREVLGLHRVAGRGKTPGVYSEVLGIPEDAPVSYRVAGQMIEQRDDLREQLYAPLGIGRRPLFVPGSDIAGQRQVLLEQIRRVDSLVAAGPVPEDTQRA
jgi:hypothetical protein